LSGEQFDNLNPATEEVLVRSPDADHEDMEQAISAARRAFDETEWSTNRALRKRCLEQLQGALESEREQMRAEQVAEVGTPVMITAMSQLDLPQHESFAGPRSTSMISMEKAGSTTPRAVGFAVVG